MSDEHIIHGEPAVPVPLMSVGEFLLQKLTSQGDKIAQVDATTKVTQSYNDVYTQSILIAEHLRKMGIRPKDVVGISSENNLDFVLIALAASYIGAIIAPFNPSYTENELLHTMSISRPRIMFVSSATIKCVLGSVQKLDCVRDVVVIGRKPVGDDIGGYKLIDELLQPVYSHPVNFIPARIQPERDTFCILCSSGTTGLPKGVELSNHNFMNLIHLLMRQQTKYGEADATLGMMPFFHGYGFAIALANIALGGKLVVIPRFEEKSFLQAVEEYKIDALYVVPPLMVFLGKHPMVDNYNLKHVKSIVCGAAPLGKNVEEAVKARLNNATISQGYGMTETSILATGGLDAAKTGASGTVVAGGMAKIVDVETGKFLPRYQEGEICIKGPNVMKGYRNNPKATAETIDKDGWLHTGDVGYFDSDGFLFVVDRVKELIKYKGFQVPPAELEAILYTHTGIRDAAVIGQPDDLAGELPVAFVVLQPNVKITEKEIMDYVAQRVSPQKRLRGGVKFVTEIPRNPSGKILRRVLRSKI